MNSPMSEALLTDAIETKLWNFEQLELGEVGIQLERANQEQRILLENDSVSLVMELNKQGSTELGLRNWNASTKSGQIKHAQVGVMLCLDFLFSLNKEVDSIQVCKEVTYLLPEQICRDFHLHRSDFYQWPQLWLARQLRYPEPKKMTETNGVEHPVRPSQPSGEIYRRFCPEIEKTLSFRVINPETDLDVFHQWMNQERVAKMWELDKPKQELAEYLKTKEQDQHLYSVVASLDGELLGYFELYWVIEDRLGPYYAAEHYDRGMHLLVGNTNFLGTKFFYCWFTGLTHCLFLDEPRTQRIMGEPRHDNKALLRYAPMVQYQKIKEFDFPHKRSALMQCDRFDFFNKVVLP